MTTEIENGARKVAWITGAGKGIGRGLARRLADEGWTIAASARMLDALTTLESACPSGHIHAFPLDVTDPQATADTVERIERELGDLSLVILNAGTHQLFAAEAFTVERFRGLVETNLMGTVNGLAPALSRFIERGTGHIAVVASLAGYRGLPTAAAYGTTKAALINMDTAENLFISVDL